MYNRYIGNTGKYYRVEDIEDVTRHEREAAAPPPPPEEPEFVPELPEESDVQEPEQEAAPQPTAEAAEAFGWEMPPAEESPPEEVVEKEKKHRLKLNPEALAGLPGTVRSGIKSFIPEGLNLGDILLVLVLLFLFIEGEEDEVLIVLGILVFLWIKPLLFKEDEEEEKEEK